MERLASRSPEPEIVALFLLKQIYQVKRTDSLDTEGGWPVTPKDIDSMTTLYIITIMGGVLGYWHHEWYMDGIGNGCKAIRDMVKTQIHETPDKTDIDKGYRCVSTMTDTISYKPDKAIRVVTLQFDILVRPRQTSRE